MDTLVTNEPELIGTRTPTQAHMIASLFQMFALVNQELGFDTFECVKVSPTISEYRTPAENPILTLRFLDAPIPEHYFHEERLGFPWNDVKTLKQQLYQHWSYWADHGMPFEYGEREAQIIKTLGIAKRCLTPLQPKVTMQRRVDHYVTIMLWPIIDGGDSFRAELVFS